jgi:hypothetical protein
MKSRKDISRSPFIDIWANRIRRGQIIPTSDHLMVTRTFEEIDPTTDQAIKTLKISSWNMMNRAFSKENCPAQNILNPFNNNPENIDETHKQYQNRVELQINQIVEHLQANRPAALLLQEVNFLYQSTGKYPDLKKYLESCLSERGYGLIYKHDASAKKQAIIYDKRQLQYKKKCYYEMPGEGQDLRKVLFTAQFTYVRTNQPVCLSSMHLHYDQAYKSSLVEHISRIANKSGAFCIGGGDTNRPSGRKAVGLMSDFNLPTNYDEASILHEGNDRLKNYDSFIMCPSPSRIARSTQGAGGCFYKDQVGNISIKDYPKSRHSQESLVGMPYIRPQTMVLDVLEYRQEIIASARDLFPEHSQLKVIEDLKTQETTRAILRAVLTFRLRRALSQDEESGGLINSYMECFPNCRSRFIDKIKYADYLISMRGRMDLQTLVDRNEQGASINWCENLESFRGATKETRQSRRQQSVVSAPSFFQERPERDGNSHASQADITTIEGQATTFHKKHKETLASDRQKANFFPPRTNVQQDDSLERIFNHAKIITYCLVVKQEHSKC